MKVTGRVVDQHKAPVKRAIVYVGYEADWKGIALDCAEDINGNRDTKVRLLTASDGVFCHDGLRPEFIRLRVHAAGFSPLSVAAIGLAPSTLVDVGDLELEAGVELEGRVVDEFGAGISDARLSRVDRREVGIPRSAFEPPARLAPLAVTDEKGWFRVPTMRPGRWSIRVDSDHYPWARFDGQTLDSGASSRLEFRLPRAWSIAGSLEIPGVTDYSDYAVYVSPIENVLDSKLRQERGQLVKCDRNGQFEASRLIATDGVRYYSLQARRRFPEMLSVVSNKIKVEVGSKDVRLVGSGLAGFSFELDVRDPLFDDPLIFLELRGNKRVNLTAHGFVGSQGPARFLVKDIPVASLDQEYLLRVRVEGYRDYLRGDLRLVAGEERELGLFRLEAAHMLVVRTVDSATGQAIEGAEVRRTLERYPYLRDRFGTSAPFHFDQTTVVELTDGEGIARIPLAHGYSNYLAAFHGAYAPLVEGPISPTGPPARRTVELALRRGATLKLHVVDGIGAPISGVSIRCRSTEWLEGLSPAHRGWPMRTAIDGRTDVLGRVVFDCLPSGRTEVAPIGGSGESQLTTVDLAPDLEHDVNLVMASRGGLEIVVRDGGLPLVAAQLSLCLPAGSDPPARPTLGDIHWSSATEKRQTIKRAETGSSGRARFVSVEAGQYELAISHPTRLLEETRDIHVRPGGSTVEIGLSASGVSGRVRSFRGVPCRDATVYVLFNHSVDDRKLGELVARTEGSALSNAVTSGSSRGVDPGGSPGVTRTDDRGEFCFRGLPAGAELRVVSVPRGHQPVVSGPFTLGVDQLLPVGELTARLAGSVELAVSGEVQGGLGFYRLDLNSDAGGIMPAARSVRVGLDGRAIARHLAPGRWRARLVFVSIEGGDVTATTVDETVIEVPSGGSAHLDLAAPP